MSRPPDNKIFNIKLVTLEVKQICSRVIVQRDGISTSIRNRHASMCTNHVLKFNMGSLDKAFSSLNVFTSLFSENEHNRQSAYSATTVHGNQSNAIAAHAEQVTIFNCFIGNTFTCACEGFEVTFGTHSLKRPPCHSKTSTRGRGYY